MDIFYFGCESAQREGHYLFAPGMRSAREYDIPGWPWEWGALDGAYAPKGTGQREGEARVIHHEGWTVLAMWDRSADTRGNSNAAFVARDDTASLSFNHMVALARENFPQVWERITSRQPVSVVRG